ncbi:MAG: chorismate synthase [Phycisphaerales bacterium]|nr:chorismate synthase [Phycisphaerales bacterium]
MAALSYRTAGESHGRALTIFVEGLPAGLSVDTALIDGELRRRQGGYGRGGRMKIEKDAVAVLSGVRQGRTIGAPLVMQIPNRDFRIDDAPAIHRPRPGHADFAGALKWLTPDCRETLERASARETASRVAAGALAKCLLREFGIACVGFVAELGPVRAVVPDTLSPVELLAARDANEVYTPDAAVVDAMIGVIHRAKVEKDTAGGIVEVRAFGLPPGIGSCFSWHERLDGRLMQAVGSIQAFKGAEIGLGFEAARRPGSQVHDAIYFDPAQRSAHNFGFVRHTNRAGGLEGGITNGQPLIVRGAMKPISTLLQGMDSINLKTLQPERSDYERSDVCAVPAASVVAENAVAFELARAWLEKFAGDTLREVHAAYEFYCHAVRTLGNE